METCEWLIRVANNNPEPDSIDDCYDIIPCGAKVTIRANETGWDCEAGHEYTDMETRFREGWDYPEPEDY